MTDSVSKLTIRSNTSLRDAIAAIDKGAKQIALVTDDHGHMLATVTDGDVRRGLLRGVGLNDPVSAIMQTKFQAIKMSQGPKAAKLLMQERGVHHVPIVDEEGRLVDLAYVDDLAGNSRRETLVVLMAGGLGARLMPLTETVPKPMLNMGERPILEVILNKFLDQGFYKFIIAVNYKAEMIKGHFGDGAQFGANIKYVHETIRMGTAGALSLIPSQPEAPFIVMNGDLLTTLNFGALVDFHTEEAAVATMCARKFRMQVPYGVVQFEGTKFQTIIEKPVESYFVNAGIYVLSPSTLVHLKPGAPLDMPDLFERVRNDSGNASVYPMTEYWIDIGRLEDLERARADFGE